MLKEENARRIRSLAACLAAAIVMSACTQGTSSGDSGSYVSAISKIDLSGATALAIVPSSAVTKGLGRGDTSYRIAKVTADGAIVEATTYDTKGNAVTSSSGASPQDLFKVDDEYIIATFWLQTDSSGSSTKHGYLIRKSDGAAFSLDDAGMPQTLSMYYQGAAAAYRDSSGNLYYKKETVSSDGMPQGDTAVIKVTAADPSSLTAQQISAASDKVLYFAVDGAGNVMYSDNSSTQRLRKRTGGFYNLPSGFFWTGLSGEAFVYSSGAIKKLSVGDDGTVTSADYGAISLLSSPSNCYMFRTTSRILIVYNSASSDQYAEVYNPSGVPKAIDSLPQLTLQAAASYGDYYYIAGEDSTKSTRILRVSASDYSYTDLVDSGTYDDVYQLVVNSDGSVVFNAMRMSDGKDVMAKVDGAGTVTTVSESDDMEITSLVKL